MSQTYSVEVSDRAKAIVRNLRDPSVIVPAVCAVLDQQNELTTGYIQEHMLSGPGKHGTDDARGPDRIAPPVRAPG